MQKIHATVAPDSSCWDSSWKCRSHKFFWISRTLQSAVAFKTNMVSGNVLFYSIRTLNLPLFDPSLTPWFLASVLKTRRSLLQFVPPEFHKVLHHVFVFLLGRWEIFAIWTKQPRAARQKQIRKDEKIFCPSAEMGFLRNARIIAHGYLMTAVCVTFFLRAKCTAKILGYFFHFFFHFEIFKIFLIFFFWKEKWISL